MNLRRVIPPMLFGLGPLRGRTETATASVSSSKKTSWTTALSGPSKLVHNRVDRTPPPFPPDPPSDSRNVSVGGRAVMYLRPRMDHKGHLT